MSAPYSLRRLNCRRCGVEAEAPGCAYCDACRPERISDALMTIHDWVRENDRGEG